MYWMTKKNILNGHYIKLYFNDNKEYDWFLNLLKNFTDYNGNQTYIDTDSLDKIIEAVENSKKNEGKNITSVLCYDKFTNIFSIMLEALQIASGSSHLLKGNRKIINTENEIINIQKDTIKTLEKTINIWEESSDKSDELIESQEELIDTYKEWIDTVREYLIEKNDPIIEKLDDISKFKNKNLK